MKAELGENHNNLVHDLSIGSTYITCSTFITAENRF